MLEIRPLVESDRPVFQELRLAALQESPTAFAADLEQERRLFEGRVDVDTRDSDGARESVIVGGFDASVGMWGMVGLRRILGSKTRHKAIMWGMYVLPTWRGRGNGRQLLEKTLKQASEMPGLKRVYLSVVTDNRPAIDLYRSVGFEEYGEEPQALFFDDRYFDELLMSRAL